MTFLDIIQYVSVLSAIFSLSVAIFSSISLFQRFLQERIDFLIIDFENIQAFAQDFLIKNNLEEYTEQPTYKFDKFVSQLNVIKGEIKETKSLFELIDIYRSIQRITKTHRELFPKLQTQVAQNLELFVENKSLDSQIESLTQEHQRLTERIHFLEQTKEALEKKSDAFQELNNGAKE